MESSIWPDVSTPLHAALKQLSYYVWRGGVIRRGAGALQAPRALLQEAVTRARPCWPARKEMARRRLPHIASRTLFSSSKN